MPNSYLISTIVVALIAIALGVAYQAGYLDPVIEEVAKILFKAKAKAEKTKLQAQGMKEGQDFMEDQLKGNQQASQVAEGLGGIGGLKKGF